MFDASNLYSFMINRRVRRLYMASKLFQNNDSLFPIESETMTLKRDGLNHGHLQVPSSHEGLHQRNEQQK